MVLATLAARSASQNALEIIPLRHRTAEQVLPALRALMDPGATLTGQGTQLIVRTSPANLAELRRALETIDRPLRRLQLSVRFDDALDAAAQGVEAGGRISDRGTRIDVRAQDNRSSAAERVDQRIQVLEGGHAYISTRQSTDIRETLTGFEAIPRLAGGGVVVEIAQRRDSLERQSSLGTTVSGRLGEWLEVGGAVENALRDARGMASGISSRSIGSRRVWLKVDELRP